MKRHGTIITALKFRRNRNFKAALLIPLIAAIIAQFSFLIIPSGSASADQISSEKAQAAQIAAKITLLNNQVSSLAEQYNQANLRLGQIQSQVSKTTIEIGLQQSKVDALKAKLANEAIVQYTQAGTASGLISLLQGTVTDASIKQVLINTVSFSQQDLVSAYQVAKFALQSQESQLAQEQAQAKATVDQIATSKAQAQTATQQEQQQLSQVNGNIAVLVQQQQQLLAQQAAARAEAQLQQQAQQQAQKQAQPGSGVTSFVQPNSVVPASTAAAIALSYARQELGKPYIFGAAGPGAFDCSGLMSYIFAKAGVYLPHSAAAQYDVTQRVSYSNLQPGDLVFYYQPIDHVGIYIGGGDIIVADNPSVPVKIDSLYWDGVPVGFGRVA